MISKILGTIFAILIILAIIIMLIIGFMPSDHDRGN